MAELSRRADNQLLLDALPDLSIDPALVVDAVHAERERDEERASS